MLPDKIIEKKEPRLLSAETAEALEDSARKYFYFGFPPAEVNLNLGISISEVKRLYRSFREEIDELVQKYGWSEEQLARYYLETQIRYLQKEAILELTYLEDSPKMKKSYLEFLLRTIRAIAEIKGLPSRIQVESSHISTLNFETPVPKETLEWVKKHGREFLGGNRR